MRKMARVVAIGLLALGVWLAPASTAAAEPGSAWKLSLVTLPTNLEVGTTGTVGMAPVYEMIATNIGAGDATGPVTMEATLPAGVTPIFDSTAPEGISGAVTSKPSCSKAPSQTVTCVAAGPVHPSRYIAVKIPVEVSGSPTPEDAVASVESPGAVKVTASAPTVFDDDPPPFDFLPGSAGLSTLFTEASGSPTVGAGAHPDQLTVNLGFPVDQPAGFGPTTGAGHPRDIKVDLPRGVVVDPSATGVRCTEAELLFSQGSVSDCPAESQVGMVTVVTELTGPHPEVSPLYNMVPAHEVPANLAFNVANVGIFVHLAGGVRSDSDFGLSATTHDVLARAVNPIEDAQVQLWGDPTSATHDSIRGECRVEVKPEGCPASRLETPLITMPSACSGSLTTAAHVRSWEEAENGAQGFPHEAKALASDLAGEPKGVSECSAVDFNPTLRVRPDTDAAESPSGIEVKLEVPQSEGAKRATSNVKDVKLVFPPGLALNPAAADGLEACSHEQIGLETAVGDSSPRFSLDRPRCPDGSKIGTVQVSTSLLDHSLPGSVYVAKPYDNPFDSLLGVYVVIDSPDDGIVIKLAGRTEADPNTGQLTTSFKEAPELPFERFTVNLFGGPRAALRTPSTCGSFATDSELAPWSGNPTVTKSDSFQIDRGANGGPCVANEGQMPNDPEFKAGTETPIAAAYSPFVASLRREDGSQQLQALEATLPPGLSGKLAGIQTCTEGAIAAARGRSGGEELASPSCPTASLIGHVEAGAGAGPYPYYTGGTVYLAGPYAGAPLSGVTIVPAVAGPFDLGNVVVRAPAYVDAITAQLTVKTDSAPHILQGVPLDLRDLHIALNRPGFTLNPTSCDEMSITGAATSLLNQDASLFKRFQVGGCRGLDYAPNLFLRLRGGAKRGAHPKLRAVLIAKPGQEANTARASVALPRSEFLENAHIRTVCTRVQFAAKQCPKGAIYGYARAFTPLLDEPVQGPIYLRSSDNELPDMVAALHGPADKPIELELKGRIDSVRGGIRTNFDLVPDQPVSKAIFWFKGGNRGLIVNSRNICSRNYRAVAKFDGQNGKVHDFRPTLKASCGKKRKKTMRHSRSR